MNQYEIVRSSEDFDHNLLFFKHHERGYDVEVIFNGKRVPLHSIILGGNSPYFEVNLFSTPIVPKAMTFENANIEVTKVLFEYCYTGKMKLNQKYVFDVLETANFFMMQSVIDGCCNVIKSMIDSKNCFQIWTLAEKLKLTKLEQIAFDCFRINQNEITKDFLTMSLSDLIKFLNSDIYDCEREKAFDLIKQWVDHDSEVRKGHLMNLLKIVQMENLPMDILVIESKSMCHDTDCFNLFMDALSRQTKKGFPRLEHNRKTLLILGGFYDYQSKIVETYDVDANNWTKHNVDFKKADFPCVFHNQKVYVISGGLRNTMECYDVKTWQKTSLSPMQQFRRHYMAVVADEFIYAIGGYGGGPLSSVERYDPNANQWTQLEPMPTARYYVGVAVIDKEIFAIGGYNDYTLSINECYTISTGKWRTCKPMLEKREGPGVAAVRGLIYAVGGEVDSRHLSTVERYDPSVDKWTYIKSLSSPRYGVVAINFCDSLIISGGKHLLPITNVEQYDPKKNQWIQMPSFNKARWYHNMIVVPQKLLE